MAKVASVDRLIVALDTSSIGEAIALVERLSPVVNIFKIGYALMFDPDLQSLLGLLRNNDKKFFLDAKLNDIPATVQRGVASAVRCGASFVSVHGHPAMLEAALRGKGTSSIAVMAVTALTSQSESESRDQFRRTLFDAIIIGCDGLIMSPLDLTRESLKSATGVRQWAQDMIIATPGVRLPEDQSDDHRRAGTPNYAITHGADYIIVGRPIIHAADPFARAMQFIFHMGTD